MGTVAPDEARLDDAAALATAALAGAACGATAALAGAACWASLESVASLDQQTDAASAVYTAVLVPKGGAA